MKKAIVAYQVRLSDELHSEIKALARSREVSLAIIREALEIYFVSSARARAGYRLYAEDPASKERVELIIPAFSALQRKAGTRQGRAAT